MADLMRTAVTRFGSLDVVVANAESAVPDGVDALDTQRTGPLPWWDPPSCLEQGPEPEPPPPPGQQVTSDEEFPF